MAEQVPLLPYNVYMTEPPLLPVLQADDEGGPDEVIRAQVLEVNERGVVLQGESRTGETVRITLELVAAGIARVLLESPESDGERVRLARSLVPDEINMAIEQADGHLRLHSSLLLLEISLDPFHLTFRNADGQVLLNQNYSEVSAVRLMRTILPFGFSRVNGKRVAFHETFSAEPDERFFGFGEKFTEFNKRGQRIVCWNTDAGGSHGERAYKNVPFFLSSRGYGIFVDSSNAATFDMGASNTATFSLINPDDNLDYYVIAGPQPAEIISRYADLVSHPMLPPKWSLGTWISSGFQRDNSELVLERARLIRAHEIPCDILHLDCYWQRFGNWSEMLWDNEMFLDPEGMLKELRDLGFRVCLSIHPYIGTASERYVEGDKKGYFLKNTQGETYVVDIWGGWHPPVGIIDFSNPDAVAWFKELLREPLRIGADIYKTDFGEGIPADAVNFVSMKGERYHNLYPLLYNDAVAEVTQEVTGHAGLTWGRSTYAGGQRHAAQWSGDVNCTWPGMASTLRGGLSMAVCGHAFWSHDTGGFIGVPSPELYARWAQFGSFSPLIRAHGNSSRLPWDFGPEVLAIFQKYTRLRYSLLPYIYTYAEIAAQTGLPMLRPMLLEFPDDPNAWSQDLQYMFGSELLVAPVFNERGEATVYLPEGQWIGFWSHEVLSGPRSLKVKVPLDVLPLYVRANALLPTTAVAQFTDEEPFEEITVDAYLLTHGDFELRDLDGSTRVHAELAGSQLLMRVEGTRQELSLRLIPLAGQTRVVSVIVNGQGLAEADELAGVSGWSRTEDGEILVHWIH